MVPFDEDVDEAVEVLHEAMQQAEAGVEEVVLVLVVAPLSANLA
jgi:hypothetical protein